jgi:hypothetical protein
MDLGSGIRDPGSGKIYPGSRIQRSNRPRIPDPGSGSATLVFRARYLMVLRRAIPIHYEGRCKGWALTSRLFWALKWHQAQQEPFGPKKVKIHGPRLTMARVIDIARLKIMKSKSHKKNR